MYTIITTHKVKCENCQKEHEYAIKKAASSGIAGKQYRATCPECQSIMTITDNFNSQSFVKTSDNLEPIEIPDMVIFEAS